MSVGNYLNKGWHVRNNNFDTGLLYNINIVSETHYRITVLG